MRLEINFGLEILFFSVFCFFVGDEFNKYVILGIIIIIVVRNRRVEMFTKCSSQAPIEQKPTG